MGCEGIRGRTGARAWEVIHIYHPLPGPYPLLPPPDLDKEGRVDNQRDTPPNTRLTVQPIRATSWDEARSAFRLFLFTSWDQVLERMNSPPEQLPPYGSR